MVFRVTFGAEIRLSAAPQPVQYLGGGKSVGRGADRGLEAAQGLPGGAAELAIGGALVEAALRQQLLQFQPFGPRQHPFLARPWLHERRAAAQPVGEMADGDGRRDVVDNPADLIASTANNLKKDGWQTGQSWGFEVVVPPGFNYMLADRAKAMTVTQWEHLGLTRAGGKPFPNPADKAYLLAPAGAQGPGFLMLQNFRVIMKYNPAEAYALAIGHFADRLRGGAPFVQPWPRQERELSRAERLELQQLLAQRGFYRGTPDGQLGGQTREALRGFQASIGTPADGFASSDVLERLRGR